MSGTYTIKMDARGHIVIPSEIRKAKGYGAHSLFVVCQDGDEIRLIPGEVRPKREVRMYSNEKIAQAIIDGAVTPAGIEVARASIIKLGLNPDDFKPNI